MSVTQRGSCGFLELLGVASLSVPSASQDDCGRGTTDTSGNCRKKAGQQQLGHDEDSSQQPRDEPSCNRPSADPDAPLPPVRTHQAHDDKPRARSNTSDETTRESTEHDAQQRKGRALTGETVIHRCDQQKGQAPEHRTGQQGPLKDAISATSSRASNSPLNPAHVATLRMNQQSRGDTLSRRGGQGRHPRWTSSGSYVASADCPVAEVSAGGLRRFQGC